MFKQEGYFKEFYIDNKFIGLVTNVEKDREKMGFFGQKEEKLTEDIILSNKKKIKANTIVKTQLHYLNSKII